MRLAIGIATKGRPNILGDMLRHLETQTVQPSRIIACHTTEADVPCGADRLGREIVWIQAKAGLAHQRNVILDGVKDCDVLLFLDDDFIMKPDYLAATLDAFRQDPDIVVTTGHVIADGARGPGLAFADGERLLAADEGAPDPERRDLVHNGYGCNMGLRLAPIHHHQLRFDEALPLYGWYEDIDFTRRLGRHGKIVRLAAARGVHLGTKTGRGSGRRLGYSQVINPIYLARKGTFDWSRAFASIGRNVAANCRGALYPEPYVDRRGRLLGNALGLADLMRGMVNPGRILTLR